MVITSYNNTNITLSLINTTFASIAKAKRYPQITSRTLPLPFSNSSLISAY